MHFESHRLDANPVVSHNIFNMRHNRVCRSDKILKLVRKAGVLRPRDLKPYNIPRIYLSRLCTAGKLRRISHGLYVLTDSSPTEHHSLVEVCKKVPKGVICLLSALRFHELTTQAPPEIWIAIGEKSWQPQLEYPPLRVMRFSKATLSDGIEEYKIEGVVVCVYSPAKTIADCFKFRNKIGLDVAIEALRECRRSKYCTMDDLWHFAGICRVRNVMRPYLESVPGIISHAANTGSCT